ncbi:MAG: hypothetical protein Q8R07_05675 [Candidatus Uhrbacteria bacterium]|nr:hypothetical protein [Candidatus Uhrbacteria bacterium]
MATNRWNQTTTTINHSGQDVAFPATNTQELSRNKTWHSLGTVNLYLQANLGSTYKIGAICIVFPKRIFATDQNLGSQRTYAGISTSGTIRIRVSANADMSSPVYDSGTINAWEIIYTTSEIETGLLSEFFPGGLPPPETIPWLQGLVRRVLLPSEVSGRYVRIDFNDSSNPAGYLEVSYVYAGRVLEVTNNIAYGWKVWREEVSREPRSASGQYWMARVYRRAKVTATLNAVSLTDMTGIWYLLLYLTGINTEVLISVVDRIGSLQFYTTIYGKFVQSSQPSNVGFSTYQIPLELEEIVA